jgi:uncharacterized damage-inducible protein DinB
VNSAGPAEVIAVQYSRKFIPDRDVPRAVKPIFQHLVDTYASEANKVGAVWSELREDQLDFRPHIRSSSIRQILDHQILSERRFFAEFIGLSKPAPESLLPSRDAATVQPYIERDVKRQRIWVFWRRVLHTAHHRAQVGMYLRMLNAKVPATYGPTADVTWSGADPTTTLDAARRT